MVVLQVDKYPNFLKSCFMHKVSWEIMKLKYQKKILAVDSQPGKNSKFVISFLGRCDGGNTYLLSR